MSKNKKSIYTSQGHIFIGQGVTTMKILSFLRFRKKKKPLTDTTVTPSDTVDTPTNTLDTSTDTGDTKTDTNKSSDTVQAIQPIQEINLPLPTQNKDHEMMFRLGHKIGTNDQKLEEIHHDIRRIYDSMAKEDDMNDFRKENKDLMDRLSIFQNSTKDMILQRLDEVKKETDTGSDTNDTPNDTSDTPNDTTDTPNDTSDTYRLSEKEINVMNLLVESGKLTYDEIAERLNITPIYAKGLVNRMNKKTDKIVKETINRKSYVSLSDN